MEAADGVEVDRGRQEGDSDRPLPQTLGPAVVEGPHRGNHISGGVGIIHPRGRHHECAGSGVVRVGREGEVPGPRLNDDLESQLRELAHDGGHHGHPPLTRARLPGHEQSHPIPPGRSLGQ